MLVPSLSFFSGFYWYRQSWLLISKNPRSLIGFSILSGIIFKALFNISLITSFLALFFMPFLSVGMMNICREIDNNKTPYPSHFLQAFKDNTKRIILLTFLSVFIVSLLLYSLMLLSGRPVFFILSDTTQPVLIPFSDWSFPEFISLLFFTIITMAFWFAPVLIVWHQFSITKSFFFSLIACLRNWKALLAYLIPFALFSFLISYVPQEGIFATFLSLFMLFVGTPWLQACFYVSFRSIFTVKAA